MGPFENKRDKNERLLLEDKETNGTITRKETDRLRFLRRKKTSKKEEFFSMLGIWTEGLVGGIAYGAILVSFPFLIPSAIKWFPDSEFWQDWKGVIIPAAYIAFILITAYINRRLSHIIAGDTYGNMLLKSTKQKQ